MTLKSLKNSESKRVFKAPKIKNVTIKTHLKAGGWEEYKKWLMPWGQSE